MDRPIVTAAATMFICPAQPGTTQMVAPRFLHTAPLTSFALPSWCQHIFGVTSSNALCREGLASVAHGLFC